MGWLVGWLRLVGWLGGWLVCWLKIWNYANDNSLISRPSQYVDLTSRFNLPPYNSNKYV